MVVEADVSRRKFELRFLLVFWFLVIIFIQGYYVELCIGFCWKTSYRYLAKASALTLSQRIHFPLWRRSGVTSSWTILMYFMVFYRFLLSVSNFAFQAASRMILVSFRVSFSICYMVFRGTLYSKLLLISVRNKHYFGSWLNFSIFLFQGNELWHVIRWQV